MTVDLKKIYKLPLFDLGSRFDARLSGIFSPIYKEEDIRKYLTHQFIEDAEIYSKKYTSHDYWLAKISKEISKLNLSTIKDSDTMILDIGSGSGNTIFPLIKLFPKAEIIASDLSIELLALLKKSIGSEHSKIHLLQLNSEELDFQENTFDIIMGGAILHHLLNPEKAIEGVYRALKKGGYAIFFEPFENGNSILKLAYSEILEKEEIHVSSERKDLLKYIIDILKQGKTENKHDEKFLSDEMNKFLKGMINDYKIRKGRNKSDEHFKHMDDKWLFTKNYFNELFIKYNFSKIEINDIHNPISAFENQTKRNLKCGLNRNIDALPEWAWEIIRKYDKAFSDDMKQDLLTEGCIIFRK